MGPMPEANGILSFFGTKVSSPVPEKPTIASRASCSRTSSGNHRCRDGGIPGPRGSSLHLHGGRSACSYSSRRSRVSKWSPSHRYSYRGSRCSVILVFSGIGA